LKYNGSHAGLFRLLHKECSMATSVKKPTVQAPTRLIRRRELEQILGISRSTIYAKMNGTRPGELDPTFPRPIRLGVRSVAWIYEEVLAWLAQQAAGRQQG
jgi:prophage regulatory protein